MTLHKRLAIFWTLLIGAPLGWAMNENTQLYNSANNWDVDGQQGVLYVRGSLSESPCRLAMTSEYQSIDMGNFETAQLNRIGAKGRAVPFQIELLDCISHPTSLLDEKTGQTAWSHSQPAVKIRFVAPSTNEMPNLALVEGAKGFGLQLSNASGTVLSLGEESPPVLLPSGQRQLTYTITPVRTGSLLIAGAYHAVISFQMLYE
ncbi:MULTISPECIES: fimbrial protein [Providencia]|nr:MULTISPECIES: fimbrial protein [Providencia]EMF0917022.1 type 1 fimbrial protein [Providencia stuartii]MCR4079889.1 type 1 fimbrial protein [Providencia stuartii]MTC20712.1 fimbrial protein [Providencia stuartii]RMA15151.1 type 1 fimbrial protein [Providencia stuartii]